MQVDQELIAAAEKLVGESPLRAKLDGRIADYRAACEADEKESSRESQQAIEQVKNDNAYIESKMLSDGVLKRAEDQVQSKAWRESRGR